MAVHVDQPSDVGAVAQSNDARAAATAATHAPTADGSARADATSTQTSPTNVNVSVRVNSPGDNGGVDQGNTAAATAQASAGSGHDPAAASSSATATQTAARNVDVSIRVASPGDEAPVSQSNTVAAETATPAASGATATQTDPSNVAVIVRIGSPGRSGTVNQANTSTAGAAPAVSTTTTGDNLVVSALLPLLDGVVTQNGAEPWLWVWDWTTDLPSTQADAAPTSSSTWSWQWTDAPAAAAPPTAVAGRWIWDWTWTRGDGWSTALTLDQPCACSWLWQWTWDWSPRDPLAPSPLAPSPLAPSPLAAAEALAPPGPAPADAAPQVAQTNRVSTTATATTDLVVVQTVASSGAGPPDTATTAQTVVSEQIARATAGAEQTDAGSVNVVSAGTPDTVAQLNGAGATALAQTAFDARQTVEAGLPGGGDEAPQATSPESISPGQSIANTQLAEADARVAQAAPYNVNRISAAAPTTARAGAVVEGNSALATAVAGLTGTARQSVAQAPAGVAADQAAEARQSLVHEQSAQAVAHAAQSDVGNVNEVAIPANAISNPAVSSDNALDVHAAATAASTVEQTSLEVAAGQAIVRRELAAEVASQADQENRSGWRGEILTPPAPEGAALPDGAAQVVELAQEEPLLEAVRDGLGLHPLGLSPDPVVLTPLAAWPTRIDTPVGAASTLVLLRPVLATASSAAALSRPSQRAPHERPADRPSRPPLQCPWCKHGLPLDLGSSSAHGDATPGPVAALSGLHLFAAPGLGRPQILAPALGQPVDLAPRERPG